MWCPYLKDRLIEERPEGFVVIVPVDAEPPTPLCCAVCQYVMRSRDDELAFVEFSCCDRCARTWAQPRRKEWETGWRPTNQQVVDAEHDRPPMTLVFRAD